MWLQACLNGSRTPAEHPDIPLTPDALAAAARAAVAAGADALHVHPRGAEGRESLAPEAVGDVLTAIREACPGVPIGLSTGAWIEPNLSRRVVLIGAWTVLPDFVSVNLNEPGYGEVVEAAAVRGIGLEAGLGTADDVVTLRRLAGVPWVRLLLEPEAEADDEAQRAADALEAALGDLLPSIPRLLHGTGGAAWALLQRAGASGYQSRIGFEDTLLLPSGEGARDNAALVRAARELLETS